jgi:ABC-type antimicrobial peptide transport system permease subunit
MLISERRREIGILRAVGASRTDVKKIILCEAAVIGAVGGTVGIGVGVAAARIIDFLSAKFVPDFPFKPTTYFLFTPELLVGALGFAVAFCVVGAFFPARQAAAMQPAQALAS